MNSPSPVVTQAPSGRPPYPFSAIVGQERMKLALVLNAVDHGIGGVLIRGEKGTAKSTAARALACLLPEIAVHGGCFFSCDPDRPGEWCPRCRESSGNGHPLQRRRSCFVTLPLNATEDMVAGGLDFSATMKAGARFFQPGLLARAHRGILYIDEVNLLDDHIVDMILDAAQSGVNIVEREGLSLCHAARFAIVASMNPEEGPLRPQLLDRFGFCVEVVSESDPQRRVDLMEKREAYEADPSGFNRVFAGEEAALSDRILAARRLLPAVRLAPHLRGYIGELTMSRHVAGHRADLIIARAALAHAALAGRETAGVKDVLEVAELALLHRGRDALSEPPPPPQEEDNRETPDEKQPEKPAEDRENSQRSSGSEAPVSAPEGTKGDSGETGRGKTGKTPEDDTFFDVGDVFRVKRLAPEEDRLSRRGSGRRMRSRTANRQGRYVKSRWRPDCEDVAPDATLRAAAPYQLSRRAATGRDNVIVYRRDWQEKVREKRVGSLILFVVDGSGSMGAMGRMVASKGAVMSLLLDAYQKRDRVAMICFRRREATLLLPPTSSIEVAGKLLREMAVGGRTPLSAALVKAYETLLPGLRRDPNLRPLVILVTDGKANAGLNEGNKPMEEAARLAENLGSDRRINWIVVDTEAQNGVRLGLARAIASSLGGAYCHMDGLKASDLIQVIKGM